MPRNKNYNRLVIIFGFVVTVVFCFVFKKYALSMVQKISVLTYPSSLKSDSSASFTCSIRGDKWIVVTSIFRPTPAIHKFLNLTTRWNLIVIGDRKTPPDWILHLNADRSRLIFLSIDDQASLGYSILKYIPEGSYARKNIGYLVAIACGARIIFESDDDNILETNDISFLPKISQPDTVPWIGFHRKRSPFINIYGHFGHPQIWPRGFPVDELRNVTEDGWYSVKKNKEDVIHAYIQQYLADLDPDVDALYRLAHPLSIGRIKFNQDQLPIAVQPYTFSSYNTQNTVTHYEAFWGLYLPITTTFRVCDIWRGFWVQRLLWDIGGHLVFGTSTVKQVRNSHSYIKDMDEEHQFYHQSGSFVRFLASWSSTLPSLAERIAQLARDIAQAKFWQQREAEILDAWLRDLHSVGYSFPRIVPSLTSKKTIMKRAAVCITGKMKCMNEKWMQTDMNLRDHLHGNIDTFLFLSSSLSRGNPPVISLTNYLKQVRSNNNITAAIIYEDRVIETGFPGACISRYNLSQGSHSSIYHYDQQSWALMECYNFVKDYEKRSKVKYQLLAHYPVNMVKKSLPHFDHQRGVNVNTTLIIFPSLHSSLGHDDLVLGPIGLMQYYMRAWHNLRQCPFEQMENPRVYLMTYLNRFANVTLDRALPDPNDIAIYEPNICNDTSDYE